MSNGFRLERGARVEPGPDGGVTFSVWCPRQPTLALRVLGSDGRALLETAMERDASGVFSARVRDPRVSAGASYVYILPSGAARPDPVSRHQPAGVHGPSRVVDPDGFGWSDAGWTGLPLHELVFYELHAGLFSPAGTFDGVAEKLDYLRDLGVTAVELMPVAAFPGDRNWGYDGVYPYAPHAAYGGPDGLKRLCDACHRHGLALVLDVVYNHLGPEGNYLGDFGPYFSDRYRTPWGDALNFDGADSDEVRRYFVDNALYWLTEYHVDGLRLDAIHGIFDFSARPILAELADAFHAEAARLGRRVHLIAESDLNDVRVIQPRAAGGLGLDAQWSDDFHHALHGVLTGNRRGYFADFGRVADLGKAITDGFVYDGQRSPHRRRHHGSSSRDQAGERLVAFIQNHDQIANGYQGRRLAALVGPEGQKAAAAVLIAAPSLPLLFMGEEQGEEAPFDYFTSHTDPALARAVHEGRHQEYLHLLEEGAGITAFADPQAEETFRRCKLCWPDPAAAGAHADMLAFYRALLALRRELPALHNGRKDLTGVTIDEGARALCVARADPGGTAALCLAALGEGPARLVVPEAPPPGGVWRLALASQPATEAPARARGGETVLLQPRTALIYVLEPSHLR
jgi:maltooligosyltrehalose trehalohydrolase